MTTALILSTLISLTALSEQKIPSEVAEYYETIYGHRASEKFQDHCNKTYHEVQTGIGKDTEIFSNTDGKTRWKITNAAIKILFYFENLSRQN